MHISSDAQQRTLMLGISCAKTKPFTAADRNLNILKLLQAAAYPAFFMATSMLPSKPRCMKDCTSLGGSKPDTRMLSPRLASATCSQLDWSPIWHLTPSKCSACGHRMGCSWGSQGCISGDSLKTHMTSCLTQPGRSDVLNASNCSGSHSMLHSTCAARQCPGQQEWKAGLDQAVQCAGSGS